MTRSTGRRDSTILALDLGGTLGSRFWVGFGFEGLAKASGDMS